MSIKITYKDGKEDVFPEGDSWDYEDDNFLVIQDEEENSIALVSVDSVLKAE